MRRKERFGDNLGSTFISPCLAHGVCSNFHAVNYTPRPSRVVAAHTNGLGAEMVGLRHTKYPSSTSARMLEALHQSVGFLSHHGLLSCSVAKSMDRPSLKGTRLPRALDWCSPDLENWDSGRPPSRLIIHMVFQNFQCSSTLGVLPDVALLLNLLVPTDGAA